MLRIQCPNCKEWLSVKYTPDMEELMITCPYCRMKSPFKDWKKNDTRRKAEEEERKKREEEERRRQEERIRREEEERQRQEEERIRREEEERKRQEEEAQRRNAEELRRRQEEEEQRRAEQERLYREEEERKKREEEERRRLEMAGGWQQPVGNYDNATGSLVLLNSGYVYSLFPGRNVVGRMASSSTADIQIPDMTGQRRMSRSHLVINVLKENGRFVHYASLNSPSVNRTCVNNIPLIYGQQVLLHSGDIIDLPDEPIRFEVIERNEEETELGFI